MKKIYYTPEANLIDMDTESLICISPRITNGKATDDAVLVRRHGKYTYTILDEESEDYE